MIKIKKSDINSDFTIQGINFDPARKAWSYQVRDGKTGRVHAGWIDSKHLAEDASKKEKERAIYDDLIGNDRGKKVYAVDPATTGTDVPKRIKDPSVPKIKRPVKPEEEEEETE